MCGDGCGDVKSAIVVLVAHVEQVPRHLLAVGDDDRGELGA